MSLPAFTLALVAHCGYIMKMLQSSFVTKPQVSTLLVTLTLHSPQNIKMCVNTLSVVSRLLKGEKSLKNKCFSVM